jgi:uncharacterized protein involved in outer membrane biogenesis
MVRERYGKARKWAIGLGVVIVLYTVIGFLVLPAIIKSQMLQRLPALTHRRVTIQEVKLNPYALSFTLRGFSLTETNGDEFISLGELYVNFESVSLLKRGFVFKEISIKKPSANVVRLVDGTFNFANLLTNAPPAKASPKPSQPLPLVMIDEVKVEDGQLAFTDLDRKKPFHRQLGPINVNLTKFTTRPKEGSPYSVVVGTEDGRTFAWSGDVTLTPLHSAGTFKLAGFQITRYAPYIEDAVPIQILSGQMDLQTDYRFAVTGEEANVAISKVTLNVSNLEVEVEQPKPARAVVNQLHLSVSGVTLDTSVKSLDVAEVRLADLKTGVTLLPGVVTTSTVAEVATPLPSQAKPAGTQTNRFQIRIGEVALENASFRFTDESVQPHVESTVGEFNGSVKGLTSDLNTVAAVDFKGKVNNYAPFSIHGKINPLASDLFVDLVISLKDAALISDSPYAAKYVGYPLEKGALTLDLRYSVSQRELKAENKVRVDQLQFGDPSNSPDAIKLPVKLGVALLQDRHGVITLNVPVNGRLDDPKFRLGSLVTQAFMNIITKAITKPFVLLGSVFGGGEDLNHVLFDPGAAEFTAGEVGKLDTLATALYERPALKLGITGSADPVKDRAALAKRKLERKLGELRARELQANGQKVTSMDSVRLTPEDRERLIKLAYAEATGLVSSNASVTGTSSVLAHLSTKQNFEPLHKTESADPSKGEMPKGPVSPADMEAKVLELTEITPDDFKKLMDKRATAVQSYLLQSGKVTPERLSVIAFKTVDASFQGSNQANLTLQ